MAKLKLGSKAPNIKLPNQDNEIFNLKESDAEYLVVYFYPKDLTPGCIIEAEEFTTLIKQFKKLGAEVIGISGEDVNSKVKFCKKHKLKITLLADEDFATSKKYGAYGKKSFMGKTYNGIHRKTFVINSAGKLIKIYDKVKAEGHAEEVLEFLKEQ